MICECNELSEGGGRGTAIGDSQLLQSARRQRAAAGGPSNVPRWPSTYSDTHRSLDLQPVVLDKRRPRPITSGPDRRVAHCRPIPPIMLAMMRKTASNACSRSAAPAAAPAPRPRSSSAARRAVPLCAQPRHQQQQPAARPARQSGTARSVVARASNKVCRVCGLCQGCVPAAPLSGGTANTATGGGCGRARVRQRRQRPGSIPAATKRPLPRAPATWSAAYAPLLCPQRSSSPPRCLPPPPRPALTPAPGG